MTRVWSPDEIAAEVQEDIDLGLSALLQAPAQESTGVTFIMSRPENPLTFDWRYTGKQSEIFRNLSPVVDGSRQIDADDVTVCGVTFVHWDKETGELTFERHVDWNDVVARLGVSRGRGGVRRPGKQRALPAS